MGGRLRPRRERSRVGSLGEEVRRRAGVAEVRWEAGGWAGVRRRRSRVGRLGEVQGRWDGQV